MLAYKIILDGIYAENFRKGKCIGKKIKKRTFGLVFCIVLSFTVVLSIGIHYYRDFVC